MIKPLFRALDASNVEELETSELESLCIQCEEKVKGTSFSTRTCIVGNNTFTVDKDTNVP